jgi:hypothetical protein
MPKHDPPGDDAALLELERELMELDRAIRAAEENREAINYALFDQAIGHATSDSTVYNLLHRHGWRNLMPRPFHPKRDLTAQNAFKKPAFLML